MLTFWLCLTLVLPVPLLALTDVDAMDFSGRPVATI